MSKLPTLNEAFRFTIEFDPSDGSVSQPCGDVGDDEKVPSFEGKGNCSKATNELAQESRLRHTLSEVAREVDRVVVETVEDVGYRGDKRQYLSAENFANERVYRSWRSFLRELADFEKKFRR